MNGVNFSIVFISYLGFTSGQATECPVIDDLNDCLCYPKSKSIHCINSANLPSPEAFQDAFTYNTIVFRNLSTAKEINKTTLGNARFHKIIIEDNKHLTTLSSDLFSNSPEVLIIRNNPQLTTNSLFEAVKNLNNTEQISIQNNTRIPEINKGTFQGSINLKQIFLQNNTIDSIKEEAFKGLTKLEEIRLDNSEITKLEEKCFDVDSESVEIKLNNITILNITMLKGIISKNITANIKLYLEKCKINDFPKEVFSPFLENKHNTIFLTGNEFNCTCDRKLIWVLNEGNEHLSRQIIHFFCNNSKDIFAFSKKDLGCIDVTTKEPNVPKEQPTRPEIQSSSPSEPNVPVERNTRKEPTTVPSTLEPNVPVEEITRKEPEPNVTVEQSTKKGPEPTVPVEESTRKEPEPNVTVEQSTIKGPEPTVPVEESTRKEP